MIAAPMTTTEKLKEFARLANLKRDLDAQLSDCTARMAELEPSLIEEMAEAGMQSTNIDDLTLYIRTDKYVSKRGEFTSQQICDCLRKHGMGYMVNDGYNAASLKSKVRELIDDGSGLPDDLKAMLNIGETQRIGSRK